MANFGKTNLNPNSISKSPPDSAHGSLSCRSTEERKMNFPSRDNTLTASAHPSTTELHISGYSALVYVCIPSSQLSTQNGDIKEVLFFGFLRVRSEGGWWCNVINFGGSISRRRQYGKAEADGDLRTHSEHSPPSHSHSHIWAENMSENIRIFA